MVEVSSVVGGERHCVADEKKRSTIVAEARMAWMWKVGDVFVSNNKLEKKPQTNQNKEKYQNSPLWWFSLGLSTF